MRPAKRRIRRSAEDSRALILAAAESLLRQGGPEAVNVRAVATSIGLTDAAINHHFGTRAELLEALLHHGGRQLKSELAAALARGRRSDHAVDGLIEVLADLYADGRYAELALQLHLSGWRDRGAGLLDPIVEAVHEARAKALAAVGRAAPDIAETRFIIALMHQTVALDPLFGREFRRSAGMNRAEEPSLDEKKRLWRRVLRAFLMGGREAAW